MLRTIQPSSEPRQSGYYFLTSCLTATLLTTVNKLLIKSSGLEQSVGLLAVRVPAPAPAVGPFANLIAKVDIRLTFPFDESQWPSS